MTQLDKLFPHMNASVHPQFPHAGNLTTLLPQFSNLRGFFFLEPNNMEMNIKRALYSISFPKVVIRPRESYAEINSRGNFREMAYGCNLKLTGIGP